VREVRRRRCLGHDYWKYWLVTAVMIASCSTVPLVLLADQTEQAILLGLGLEGNLGLG
jgi:hypothetical protein